VNDLIARASCEQSILHDMGSNRPISERVAPTATTPPAFFRKHVRTDNTVPSPLAQTTDSLLLGSMASIHSFCTGGGEPSSAVRFTPGQFFLYTEGP